VVADAADSPQVALLPSDFEGIKPRLLVSEGDRVKRGTVLFHHKKNHAFRFRAPAGGTVKEILLGERRAIQRLVIDVDEREPPEAFRRFQPEDVLRLTREEALQHLLDTGYFAFIRQRPFSRIADPQSNPKSIFVNGMATAPFQVDAAVAIAGHETAFQAGINVLARLTEGRVFVCLPPGAPSFLAGVRNANVYFFAGPHPSGNTSVHIHHVAPLRAQDVVWTIRAADVAQVGRLFLEGALPESRVIALGGPGVAESARRHYRVRPGASLGHLLRGRLADGELRVIDGDALAGAAVKPDSYLRFHTTSLTVLREGRERRLLGWMAAGSRLFSHSRAFVSTWLGRPGEWPLDTSQRGSRRAMVLTGLYDRYLPMDLRVDYVVRAALAHDTDEAVKLGILETDPEDFALCAFVCPSKMDLVGIIRNGLAEIEREGL
jgi:Na+-transporting NADH:ubiquinone oxidoreductase subunit A